MDIKRQLILNNGVKIPAVTLTPEKIIGSAIIIHGYGGSKEEQLGLALGVSELGLKTTVIDLRGHGENSLPFDSRVLEDVEELINTSRNFGKITVIGHSLGGRLALISHADAAIGISPAMNQHFGKATMQKLADLRAYRVHPSSPDLLNHLLKTLRMPDFANHTDQYVLYGTRDIPEIYETCRKLPGAFEISEALHSDIFTLPKTFSIIRKLLKTIYPKETRC
ncbi:alpha/beta hydrolase [Sporolactobacillus laevolacticus]|uniref:AB hydrolase-1 domain-containing protein n=1 Tax=Sporolactobacillus laevolacticus DSM 442 TaxID=1395513 RepID=V6IXF4_9BACL|nr:alpha/beta fold hydrolase [Sporolactobacillus laevolacticus]EST11326.1 hypothetical protein P343_12130 [Sporolactobacillus laevolacticus DSM 442]